MHYLKSGYIVYLITFQWDIACTHSSPDLESGWVWLVRLGQTLQARASGLEDEGLEMRSGGSWVNTPGKLILCSQTIKLSFALRSSCQTADGKTFETIVSALTSYSDAGRTLDT